MQTPLRGSAFGPAQSLARPFLLSGFPRLMDWLFSGRQNTSAQPAGIGFVLMSNLLHHGARMLALR